MHVLGIKCTHPAQESHAKDVIPLASHHGCVGGGNKGRWFVFQDVKNDMVHISMDSISIHYFINIKSLKNKGLLYPLKHTMHGACGKNPSTDRCCYQRSMSQDHVSSSTTQPDHITQQRLLQVRKLGKKTLSKVYL